MARRLDSALIPNHGQYQSSSGITIREFAIIAVVVAKILRGADYTEKSADETIEALLKRLDRDV